MQVALQQNSMYRFFPMPQIFNFRPETLFPLSGPGVPAVLHSKLFKHFDECHNYESLALRKVTLIFDECEKFFFHSISKYFADIE